MSTTLEISPLWAADTQECARILAASFGTDPARVRLGLADGARERVLVLRDGDRIVGTATLRLRTAGFCGELVPVAVIANVAVEPQARGRGLGRLLVEELLAEIRRREIEVALLVPEEESFWSRFGFVRGGVRHAAKIDLGLLRARETRDSVRPFEPSDLAACTRLARAMARERLAWVVFESEDRARRLRAPRRAFALERAGELRAACTVSIPTRASAGALLVHELLATDRAAAAALWSHLARVRPVAGRARWRVAPHDPLAVALGGAASFCERGPWMIRLESTRAGGAGRVHRIAALFAATPPSLSALP